MKELILYTTAGCHLCEQAEYLIMPTLKARDIVLQRVDISESDELLECYGVRIPVIRWPGHELDLGWPFAEDEFLEYLALVQA